jgi:hypothetical protein
MKQHLYKLCYPEIFIRTWIRMVPKFFGDLDSATDIWVIPTINEVIGSRVI